MTKSLEVVLTGAIFSLIETQGIEKWVPGWKAEVRQALNARKSQLIVKMTARLQSTNSMPRHRLEVKQLAW